MCCGVSHPKTFSLCLSLLFCLTVSCSVSVFPSFLSFRHCHLSPALLSSSPTLPVSTLSPRSSFPSEQPSWHIQQEVRSCPICHPHSLSLASHYFQNKIQTSGPGLQSRRGPGPSVLCSMDGLHWMAPLLTLVHPPGPESYSLTHTSASAIRQTFSSLSFHAGTFPSQHTQSAFMNYRLILAATVITGNLDVTLDRKQVPSLHTLY